MPRYSPKVVMRASVGVSVVMLVGKLWAYGITHSAAIFSDAAESVAHAGATGLAAFSMWFASRRPDANHPYGHGRIAYFSIGVEGALIFVAALGVIFSGIRGLIWGVELHNLGRGFAMVCALASVNVILGLSLIGVGKRHNSIILLGHGKHVLSDVWTTAAAAVGVGLVVVTGRTWLDPVTAMGIGCYILATGASLVRKAFGGLMDELDPAFSRRLVEGLEARVRDGLVLGFHQLRCRQLNDEIWVDVHLLVPGELTTLDAHARVSKVEDAIRQLFPDFKVRVTTHVEPADHERAHPGGHQDLDEPLKPLFHESP